MPGLAIATPCYGGLVTSKYLRGILETVQLLSQHGIKMHYLTVSESLIHRARNRLTHAFLKTDAERLLWIDADIGFKGADVLKLWELDADVAAAPYPKKEYNWEAISRAHDKGKRGEDLARAGANFVWNFSSPEVTVHPPGWVEVLDAGTGFLMVKRHVHTEMAERHPEFLYLSDNPGEPEPMFDLWECTREDRRLLSEDYAFCRRAQELGYTVKMRVDVELQHEGPHAFFGNPLGCFEVEEVKP